MGGMKTTPLALAYLVTCSLLTASTARAVDVRPGHNPQVSVQAATRLDWIFALANQSPAQAPADWLPGYDSTAQKYELYVPANLDRTQPVPLVLFISAGPQPAGLTNWRTVCDAAGVLFASPFGAGNNTTGPLRTRIVMDVLDDVRRRFNVDPDRTYLGGFSGGGRAACNIAFALPEYFGGVVPCCAAEGLRDEPWLRHRVIDRLSAALLTGETDFNRGELERYRGPLLTDVGVRTKVWTVPKMGHAIPPATVLAEAVRWLEEGLPERRRKATERPAMRLTSDPPSREAWSQALLAEAKKQLQTPAKLYAGLSQLQGVMARWSDLPAATEATRLLTEYDAKEVRPWEQDDIDEQRKFLVAEARGLGNYAVGDLPQQYLAERKSMAEGSLERWQVLFQDDPMSAIGKEARMWIPRLMELIDKEK